MKKALVFLLVMILSASLFSQRVKPDTSFKALLVKITWVSMETCKLTFLNVTKDSVYLFTRSDNYQVGQNYEISFESSKPRKRTIQGESSTIAKIKEW